MIVITGAGPIGTHVAQQLVDAGTPVRVLTRSGSGLDHPLVERRAVDVNDRAALLDALQDATVVHHCIHASAYVVDVWERELPAAEQVLLDVAEQVGATVVFPESLYAFDLTQQPITETTPITATTGKPGVRRRLLEARAASPVPTISVVASDYFGPRTGPNAHVGDRMVAPATTGKVVRPLGSVDQPHSWTYLPDLAAAMIRAAELPTEPDRVLLAPTGAPRTQREVAADYAAAAGRSRVRVSPVPTWALRIIGRFHAGTAGLVEMIHLLEEPLVMDSSASEALLDLAPTPWDVAVKTVVAAR